MSIEVEKEYQGQIVEVDGNIAVSNYTPGYVWVCILGYDSAPPVTAFYTGKTEPFNGKPVTLKTGRMWTASD